MLADIHGRPMLWYVYQAVSKSKHIDDVWVLTDSEEVFEIASAWGAKALMTSEECPSGTARIASVIDQLDGDIIVNVQGDEPLIVSSVVDAMVSALERTDVEVATPVYRINSLEELTNVNINKVVRSSSGAALYFSHTPIPYVRDVKIDDWLSEITYWGHVGVYGYRRRVLERYLDIPMGRLESVEKLEQLRLLEAGIPIQSVEIDYRPVGVDVPAELEAVKKLIDPAIAMGAAS